MELFYIEILTETSYSQNIPEKLSKLIDETL